MLNKKLLPIIPTLVLTVTSVHAATSAVVSIPDLKQGFAFGITALALKPGASNLNYVIYNKELPAQSPTWIEQEIQMGYGGAFGLNGSYFFAEGRNINIDWTHLNTSSSESITADNAEFFLGPDYEIGPDGIPVRDATGNANFSLDIVNLDVGQYVSFGDHVQMRFFGGLSSGYLREQVQATYTGTILTAPAGPFSMQQTVVSSFTGLGPRLGIDASYNTGYGLGLLAEGAVSALVGSIGAKTHYLSSAPLLLVTFNQTSNYQFIKDQTVMQVIPGFDGKLGVSYTHAMKRGCILTLKAGYEAAVYVNAISQYLPSSLVTPFETGGIFVDTMTHTLSNYSVQGPFFNVTLQL